MIIDKLQVNDDDNDDDRNNYENIFRAFFSRGDSLRLQACAVSILLYFSCILTYILALVRSAKSLNADNSGQPLFNMALACCIDVRMVSVHVRRT